MEERRLLTVLLYQYRIYSCVNTKGNRLPSRNRFLMHEEEIHMPVVVTIRNSPSLRSSIFSSSFAT